MKLTFLLIAGLFLASCSQARKENPPVVQDHNEMPPLALTGLSGEKVMVNTLPGKTILIFYSPECDHCQRQAEDIRRQLGAFRNYTLYFIASGIPEASREFAQKYQLSGYANVLFVLAEVPDVIRIIGPISTPSIFIYSAEKKLVKNFDGETPVEDIIKFL